MGQEDETWSNRSIIHNLTESNMIVSERGLVLVHPTPTHISTSPPTETPSLSAPQSGTPIFSFDTSGSKLPCSTSLG